MLSIKHLSLIAFVACLLKSAFSIYTLVIAEQAVTLNDTLILFRDFVDISMWFIMSLFFLHIYLYRDHRISRTQMSTAAAVAFVFAVIKVICTIVCTLFFVNHGLPGIIYALAESLLVLWAFVYVCLLWHSKLKGEHKLSQQDKPQEGYTFADELERRLTHKSSI